MSGATAYLVGLSVHLVFMFALVVAGGLAVRWVLDRIERRAVTYKLLNNPKAARRT